MQVCDEGSQTICTVSFWLMPTVGIASPMGRPATKLEAVGQDERPRRAHEGPLQQNSSRALHDAISWKGKERRSLRRDWRGAHAAWPRAGVSVRGNDVLQRAA